MFGAGAIKQRGQGNDEGLPRVVCVSTENDLGGILTGGRHFGPHDMRRAPPFSTRAADARCAILDRNLRQHLRKRKAEWGGPQYDSEADGDDSRLPPPLDGMLLR